VDAETTAMGETVTHYKSELDAYKQQLATATGVRDIQAFLSDARSLKTDIDNLRKNGISLDDLLTNQNSSYSSELQYLYNKYKSFDTCNPSRNSQRYLDSCKQMILNQAMAIENTSDVENRITAHSAIYQTYQTVLLMRRIRKSLRIWLTPSRPKAYS
jgi:type IV secretion system protein VirB5